ncbi:hypothetical protein Ddc_14686 [Ditylenchus destructor]|nr:hypothetical protein Ddc_14686 [Ditylenchus destructor]
MPVYLAEDPLSESFAFLNRSSLDKLSLASHRFNRIISSRFKNAPFRVFENVVIHCEKYRNKLDVNGIVAFIRRIFLKSLQIVKSEEENEPDFLCKIVWDNRSVTTSLSKRFQSATSIVPFKFIFQFHGYLEQDIVDYVYRHSSLVNSESEKVLNIEAVAERPSQITVSVEDK